MIGGVTSAQLKECHFSRDMVRKMDWSQFDAAVFTMTTPSILPSSPLLSSSLLFTSLHWPITAQHSTAAYSCQRVSRII